MTAGQWVIAAWAGLGALLWIALYLRAWRALQRMPSLAEAAAPRRERWPRVSVIVAACDEVDTIGPAAETLLALDYPDLEIVLVDDRSTDGTGAIIDELAARDPRARAVHVADLPDGWLGKVHALARGVEIATGRWLLFCDADIHMAPDALRRAVDLAERGRLDHVPVLPVMEAPTFWLEAAFCCFGVGYLATTKADQLLDPESDAFAGVGAFNLVRADTLRRSEGLEWLRMEIADDVGIGMVVKRAGGRTGIAVGGPAVRCAWYESIPAMARGLEKNMFAAFGHFSVALTLLRAGATAAVALAPLAGLLLPAWTYAWALPIPIAASVALFARAMSRRGGQRFGPALAAPLAVPVLLYMVLRSTWICRRAGGVTWRGRFYPLAALRAGQRVKI